MPVLDERVAELSDMTGSSTVDSVAGLLMSGGPTAAS